MAFIAGIYGCKHILLGFEMADDRNMHAQCGASSNIIDAIGILSPQLIDKMKVHVINFEILFSCQRRYTSPLRVSSAFLLVSRLAKTFLAISMLSSPACVCEFTNTSVFVAASSAAFAQASILMVSCGTR
jgi:hypothetical protein